MGLPKTAQWSRSSWHAGLHVCKQQVPGSAKHCNLERWHSSAHMRFAPADSSSYEILNALRCALHCETRVRQPLAMWPLRVHVAYMGNSKI